MLQNRERIRAVAETLVRLAWSPRAERDAERCETAALDAGERPTAVTNYDHRLGHETLEAVTWGDLGGVTIGMFGGEAVDAAKEEVAADGQPGSRAQMAQLVRRCAARILGLSKRQAATLLHAAGTRGFAELVGPGRAARAAWRLLENPKAGAEIWEMEPPRVHRGKDHPTSPADAAAVRKRLLEGTLPGAAAAFDFAAGLATIPGVEWAACDEGGIRAALPDRGWQDDKTAGADGAPTYARDPEGRHGGRWLRSGEPGCLCPVGVHAWREDGDANAAASVHTSPWDTISEVALKQGTTDGALDRPKHEQIAASLEILVLASDRVEIGMIEHWVPSRARAVENPDWRTPAERTGDALYMWLAYLTTGRDPAAPPGPAHTI